MGDKSGLVEFNWVTVAIVLALLGAGYGAWKFVPPYWEAQKVDEVLSKAKFEASKINLFSGDERAEDLTNRILDKLTAMGIDERYLEVYFSEDFTSLHADYSVEVRHLVGGTTTLEFERSLEIPQADTAD